MAVGQAAPSPALPERSRWSTLWQEEVNRLHRLMPAPEGGPRRDEVPVIAPEVVWRSLGATTGASGRGSGHKLLVLVDVRTSPEQAISMIPGAITKEQYERDKQRYSNATIVFHCTLGYRGGLHAAAARNEGYDAYNLDEALLGWVARGLPLVDPITGLPTRRVHTLGPKWAALLPPGYEAKWSQAPGGTTGFWGSGFLSTALALGMTGFAVVAGVALISDVMGLFRNQAQ